MNAAVMLTLFIAIPLTAAFIMPLLGLIRRETAPVLALAVTGLLAVLAIMQLSQEPVSYAVGGWNPPFGINLVGDALSHLLHLTIAVISILVAVYAIPYMRQYTDSVRFYILFLLMVAGMNGVVASGDIFNIFVFLEVASIASYGLVAFGIEQQELEAAFKYMVLGIVGSTFILLGIALLYNQTGTLNLADNARILAMREPSLPLHFTAALFLCGFGLKAAMVPFHAWLPDAHSSAPAPISAMLSGLLIKALGVYCLLRVFALVFGFGAAYLTVFRWLGLISLTIGAFLAIGQDDFKRLLAYSSISQMGYILFAAGLGTPLGMLAALLHLVNHAVFKSLLFLCAGAVEQATGTRELSQLGGLWKRMPVTATTCAVGSFSISGIPPFGGFFSKVLIIVATIQAADIFGQTMYWQAGMLVLVSFVTLAYFVKVQKLALFGPPGIMVQGTREVSPVMGAVMVLLAIVTLGLGLALPQTIDLIEPARDVLFDIGGYIQMVLGVYR